ncbi:MAG: four helix bundle protein [Acidobacteria bacterium]|nr:four helix bundle protein [Acidobacteriota bacterium]
MRLVRSLPNSAEARVMGSQVLRSATAIGANYRAAGRGRSRAQFAAKIGIVLEEADETVYWLELLIEGGVVAETRMAALFQEAEELVKIFAAMKGTLRKRRS